MPRAEYTDLHETTVQWRVGGGVWLRGKLAVASMDTTAHWRANPPPVGQRHGWQCLNRQGRLSEDCCQRMGTQATAGTMAMLRAMLGYAGWSSVFMSPGSGVAARDHACTRYVAGSNPRDTETVYSSWSTALWWRRRISLEPGVSAWARTAAD